MRIALALAACAAVTGLTAFSRAPRTAVLSAFDKTTWDSVYTDAQAARGDSLYKATCAKCHGPTLKGTDNGDGGPLVEKQFLDSWNGMTLDQLFSKIYTTMPSDNPKTIAQKDVADIMAYLLAQNHFPSGSAALTENLDQLKTIKLATSKP